MKVKNSFVTNSSSTSYIITFSSNCEIFEFPINVMGSSNRPPLTLDMFQYMDYKKIATVEDLGNANYYNLKYYDEQLIEILNQGKIIYLMELCIDDCPLESDPIEALVASMNWDDRGTIINPDVSFIGIFPLC